MRKYTNLNYNKNGPNLYTPESDIIPHQSKQNQYIQQQEEYYEDYGDESSPCSCSDCMRNEPPKGGIQALLAMNKKK